MNPNVLTPSVFESFNARVLSPALVAKSFVPSSNFARLATRAHSLVIGPRGSGKTTMLKMLQPAALEAWHLDVAEVYRSKVDYTGIFVPTDVSWGKQLEALGGGKLDTRIQAVFGNATFTYHVLRSLLNSVIYRTADHEPGLIPFRRFVLTTEQEHSLVSELSEKWILSPKLPRLTSLKYAITARISEIHALAHQESLLEDLHRGERLASAPFLHLHFLSAAAVAIEICNDIAQAPHDRWAFLIDEFELAPTWIRQELLKAMRSTDERFLFKLSMSPYSKDVEEITNILSAMPGNDYIEVPLWFPHKEEGYTLCESLFNSIIKEKGLKDVSAEQIFGTSVFDSNFDEWSEKGNAYHVGSRQYKRLLRMSKKDRTFRTYLKAKRINLLDMEYVTTDKRAAELRKIGPLLAVRETFRSADGDRQDIVKERSRKNPGLYSGAKSLFAMVEGNPRWFIGIVENLINQYISNSTPVSPARQSRAVGHAAERFRALLGTVPYKAKPHAKKPTGLLDVLDAVGEYLFKSVVIDDFNPDPPGSFIVNQNSDPALLNMLGVALNTGAIVYIPSNAAELVLKSLEGKRFRLSYLLSPTYRIPIRLGRPISLEKMVSLDNFNRAEQVMMQL